MNIYAKEGHKIRAAKNINGTWNGYDSDGEKADKYLRDGNVYTVEKINVDSWSSDVWLKEFPGIRFNTVLFEDAEPAAKKVPPSIQSGKGAEDLEKQIQESLLLYQNQTNTILKQAIRIKELEEALASIDQWAHIGSDTPRENIRQIKLILKSIAQSSDLITPTIK